MTSSAPSRTAEDLSVLLNLELERMKSWKLGGSIPYASLLKSVDRLLAQETAHAEGTRFLEIQTEIDDFYTQQVRLGKEVLLRPTEYIASHIERTVPKSEDGKIPFSFMVPRYLSERTDTRHMYGLHFVIVGDAKSATPTTFGCILDLGEKTQYRTYLQIHEILHLGFSRIDTGSTPLVR